MLNEINVTEAMRIFCSGGDVYTTQGYYELTESTSDEEREVFRITSQNHVSIFTDTSPRLFWVYVAQWNIEILKPTKIQCIDSTVVFHYHSAREASSAAQPLKLLLGESIQ